MRQILLEGRALPIFPCRFDKRPTCPHGFKDAVADPKAIGRIWGLSPPGDHWPPGTYGGLKVIKGDR